MVPLIACAWDTNPLDPGQYLAHQRQQRLSPAGVGETIRVVRSKSTTPNSSSSLRSCWLSADCTTYSLTAALVKLWASASATA